MYKLYCDICKSEVRVYFDLDLYYGWWRTGTHIKACRKCSLKIAKYVNSITVKK